MPKLIAVVGALLICAGLDLLWQSRTQIRYWLEAYAKFLADAWRRQLPARLLSSAKIFMQRQAAVQILLGLSLVFFFGPLLLAVSLTLILYPRFF